MFFDLADVLREDFGCLAQAAYHADTTYCALDFADDGTEEYIPELVTTAARRGPAATFMPGSLRLSAEHLSNNMDDMDVPASMTG